MCKCHNCVALCFLAFLSDNCGWSWLFIKTVSDWALLTFNCWNKKSGKFNIFGKRNYAKQNVFSVIFSHFYNYFYVSKWPIFSQKLFAHLSTSVRALLLCRDYPLTSQMFHQDADQKAGFTLAGQNNGLFFGDPFIVSSEKEQFITFRTI